MRPRVELIYDRDCPNAGAARGALLRALKQAGQPLTWFEWDRASSESPAYVRGYASPTILVSGRDVLGAEPADGGAACRLYADGAGRLGGVPPEARIVAALEASARGGVGWWWRRPDSGAWGLLASLPAMVASLLPVGICPACWPLYAGVLGSLGLGFLLDATYLLPVALVLFGLVLVSLAFRARHRRGLGPFWLGSMCVAMVLLFKFVYHFDPLVYAGLAGLLAVSVWNAWPLSRSGAPACPSCVPQDGVGSRGNAERSR